MLSEYLMELSLQGWVRGSQLKGICPLGRARRSPSASQTETEGATEPGGRAFWYNPEIFNFLQSRGSGGMGSGGKNSEVNMISSWALEQWVQWWRLIHWPAGSWAWSAEPRKSPLCIRSSLPCGTAGHPSTSDSGFAVLSLLIQEAYPCLVPGYTGTLTRQTRSSLSLHLKTAPLLFRGPSP